MKTQHNWIWNVSIAYAERIAAQAQRRAWCTFRIRWGGSWCPGAVGRFGAWFGFTLVSLVVFDAHNFYEVSLKLHMKFLWSFIKTTCDDAMKFIWSFENEDMKFWKRRYVIFKRRYEVLKTKICSLENGDINEDMKFIWSFKTKKRG